MTQKKVFLYFSQHICPYIHISVGWFFRCSPFFESQFFCSLKPIKQAAYYCFWCHILHGMNITEALKLRIDVRICSSKFILKLKHEVEDRLWSCYFSWSLNSKFVVEVWSWYLKLKFKVCNLQLKLEVWSQSLKPKFDGEV